MQPAVNNVTCEQVWVQVFGWCISERFVPARCGVVSRGFGGGRVRFVVHGVGHPC